MNKLRGFQVVTALARKMCGKGTKLTGPCRHRRLAEPLKRCVVCGIPLGRPIGTLRLPQINSYVFYGM